MLTNLDTTFEEVDDKMQCMTDTCEIPDQPFLLYHYIHLS